MRSPASETGRKFFRQHPVNWLKTYFRQFPAVKILKGLAALTQLRVGLSALNFHKFMRNFNDTLNPMCPINDGVEDTEHYLLHCHSYHLQRNSLLSRVQAILLSYGLLNLSNEELVSIILYGDERLPIESNKAIIKATLEFIESSKRFL